MQIAITNISTSTIYINYIGIPKGATTSFTLDDTNIASIIEEIHKQISCIKIDLSTIIVQNINYLYGVPRIEFDSENRLISIFTLWWIQSTINNYPKIQTQNETPNILENTRNVDTQ
jgi:hypothetical protein